MSEHPLKTYRERLGLSQRALAELLGVGVPTICRWETGARKIDDLLILHVAIKTGIRPNRLRPDLAELFQ